MNDFELIERGEKRFLVAGSDVFEIDLIDEFGSGYAPFRFPAYILELPNG